MFVLLAVIAVIAAIAIIWLLLTPDKHTRELGNKIPGPPAYPIVGNLLDFLQIKSGADVLNWRRERMKEYGHLYRFWHGRKLYIAVSDPQIIEVLLGSMGTSEKAREYGFLHPWLGTGLLTAAGEKWYLRRKALTPAFHFKILEQFLEVFNKNGNILVNCLKNEVGESHFDIQPFITRYALDVICESAMGTEIRAQLNPSSEYVQAVKKMCDLLFLRLYKPWLKNNLIFTMAGLAKIQSAALKILHSFTDKVIQKKKKMLEESTENEDWSEAQDLGVKKRTAFLEHLLQIAKKSDVFKTDTDIREEVDTFMFEGHDTTTHAGCYILQLLAKYPEVQEKVYQEIKSIGANSLKLTHQDLMTMNYLERVIKESLRLYPSVPVIARVLTQDVAISSIYTLPKGSTAVISAFFTHRNEQHYENPEEFNPDNFLPERIVKRHPYAYIPFSAGPRNCIGQRFAMLELKSMICKIVSCYKIGYCGPNMDATPNPSIVLRSLNGFNVKLRTR